MLLEGGGSQPSLKWTQFGERRFKSGLFLGCYIKMNDITSASHSLFALLGLDLTQVKFELFSFENIAVSASHLARSR